MKVTRNRSGYYQASFKDQDGKRHTMSTGRTNLNEARQVISDARIAELERAAELSILTPAAISIIQTGKSVTVEEAIQPWIEWREMKHHSPHTIADARTWVKAWAYATNVYNRPLRSVTERHIDLWINSTESKNKMGTRAVMLSAIRSFFTYCSAKGWTTGDPSSLVSVDPFLLLHEQKETNKQPVFTDEEVNALLTLTSENGRRPDDFWHAAVAIGRWTGLRISDIASLEWSCLAVLGKISVWTQKRDRRVELPLEPEQLRDSLLRVPRQDSNFLFPAQREMVRDPNQRSKLSMQFRILCDLCGIVGKSFHGLRGTYVTACRAQGIPIEHIAVRVGHSDPRTTLGYVRPDC